MPPSRAPRPATAPSTQDGFLTRLLLSMVTPGIAPEAIKLVYFSLGGLVITGISMAVITGGSIHVYIMLGLATALFISFSWFLSNLKASVPRHFEDLEEDDKSAKRTKLKRKKAAPMPTRAAPEGASSKNEQREPEAQEITLPRTLGGASANKLAAAGAAKAPSNAGVGKAAAKKIVAAPAAAEADGWTVNVTKAQKQRKKRKEKPAAAPAPAAAPVAPEAAPVDQAAQ